jgi:SAM-dependent methyltransferase
VSATAQQKDYYQQYWAKGRPCYSGDRQGYAANFRDWMHGELNGLPRDSAILEVGCGDASFTKGLAEYASAVTAIDIAAGQIAENARRFPEITFLQHDVSERFPFPDRAFDVIWCSEVLEHLFDPGFALSEIHRILNAGGRLLLTVPHHGRLKNVLIALFKWDEHFAPTNPHLRFFTKNSLGRLTAAAGFQQIEITTCGMNQPLRDWIIPTNILLKARRR